MFIEVLALLGIFLSVYALRVEVKLKHDREYRALCDIRRNISCTRAFGSRYGHLTGAPNPLLGIFFYLIVILLAVKGQGQAIKVLSIAAVLASAVLAYLSYVKQRNFCVVCSAIYLINLLLLLLTF